MVNKKAGLDYCNNISLSDFTKIQPFGALLIIDRKNYCVLQCSTNVSSILNITPEELLKTPVTNFLYDINNIISPPSWLLSSDKMYHQALWKNKQSSIEIRAYVHQINEIIALEVEIDHTQNHFSDILFILQEFLDFSKQYDLQTLATVLCKKMQEIFEFDRVSIYQFNKDNTGTVIGEAIKENQASYLGIRFPDTDVPQTIRMMYMQQPIRYIPTIHYNPVDLIPRLNPLSNKPIDLSNFIVREVSPIHLQYIQNMGAQAALSVAITHNDKLWGLISFQHKTPKFVPTWHRILLNLMGKTIIRRLALQESEDTIKNETEAQRLQALIGAQIMKKTTIHMAIEQSYQSILNIFNAQGLTISWEGDNISYGNVPTNHQINTIISWLRENTKNSIYSTENLAQSFFKRGKRNCYGLLAIPIPDNKNDFLLIFRNEVKELISWAGNPHKILSTAEAEYSPRNSFETWIEEVKNHSPQWNSNDIKAAEYFQTILNNKKLQILLERKATHDPMTGLLNRQSLMNTLINEINRANRTQSNLTISIFDVDFFKTINDNYGHLIGDEVIIGIGNIIRSKIRSYDLLYRYGGEEFLLIMLNTNSSDALKRVENIRTNVSKTVFKFSNTILPSLTLSSGVATLKNKEEDAKSLINRADAALYKAKKEGRNKTVLG